MHGPLSLSLSPSLSLSLSVCGYLPLFKNPLVTSNAMCSCSVWLFRQVNSQIAERRKALEISPECGFVPPGCRSGGTSRCRLRPPCSAVLSHPVCSPPHHGRAITASQAIGWTSSPPHSRGFLLVDRRRLLQPDWSIFTNCPEVGQQMSQLFLNYANSRGEEEIMSRPWSVPKLKKHKI